MFDDGYNRKKSKKRKKKQGGDKQKKPKIESKSKKEGSKFNVQDVIKVEVKTEPDICNPYEYESQENIEEIPVPQGSYNDTIIIENVTEDPLKINSNPLDDFNPPEIEKCAKKKRHSKHNEQKKLKQKRVPKNKRKRDNSVLSDYMPTSDIYNINKIPEKDIISRSINSMPSLTVSLSKLKSKTINKINTNQMNPASNDNQKETAKSSAINMAENRATICSSTNDTSDISTIFSELDKSSCVQAANIGCQTESIRDVAVSQIKQCLKMNYKNMGAMSMEDRSINNTRKDLIKPPRLKLPPLASQGKNYAENQQIPSKIEMMTDVIDTKNSDIYLTMPLTSINCNPPVLKNETEAQCMRNNNAVKSPPSLEIPNYQDPTDIINRPNNPNCSFINSNVPSYRFTSTNFNHFNEIKMEHNKTLCMNDVSEEFINSQVWRQNKALYTNFSNPSQRIALTESDSYIHIPSCVSPPNAMLMSQCQYSPVILKNISESNFPVITPDILPAACSSKRVMSKLTRNPRPRQRPQKGASRKKPPTKNNKSNNNASSSISQANISSSVGTQLNSPFNLTLSDLSDPNIQSRITDIQNDLHENKHLNISDNKLQDLEKQKDIYSSYVPPSKSKPSILRKKPKEKKATERRKPMNFSSETDNPTTDYPMILHSVTITPDAFASTTITSAVVASTTTTSATIAPMDIAPVTTTMAVVPTIVAPVMEATKDQSTSTQSADISELCSQSMVIPGHISDMIYPNVPSNELLKAFNNYWSAQVSHCAICAIFASCTSGSSRMMPPDWKYCTSTMLPESTPIWVRK